MKVMIVFESMYGNTRRIAEAIGSGFDRSGRGHGRARRRRGPRLASVPICSSSVDRPTSTVSPPRPAGAPRSTPPGQDPTLALDPTACGAHLREWLNALPHAQGRAAAFDTRLDAPVLLTGHASATIARRLKRRGYHLIVDPESFLVDHESTLIDGELERARRWGEALSAEMHSRPTRGRGVTRWRTEPWPRCQPTTDPTNGTTGPKEDEMHRRRHHPRSTARGWRS